MPGDNVSLVIELITPVAMEKGLRFAIREGGHTVGAGTIAEIITVRQVRGEKSDCRSKKPTKRLAFLPPDLSFRR